MQNAISNLLKLLRGASLVAIGGIVGWLANQYMDYRTAYREALEANYESFNGVATEIEQSLKHFADVTRGLREKTPVDVETLQLKLLSAVNVAEDLQRRIHAEEGVIQRYKDAAVDLQRASESLSGPLDGKTMVSAVSEYLYAEQQLRDAVMVERNAFF